MYRFVISSVVAIGLWFVSNSMITPIIAQASGNGKCNMYLNERHDFQYCSIGPLGYCYNTCNVTFYDTQKCDYPYNQMCRVTSGAEESTYYVVNCNGAIVGGCGCDAPTSENPPVTYYPIRYHCAN